MSDHNENIVNKNGEIDIDFALQYGKYQAIRIWIFGSILGEIKFSFVLSVTKNLLFVSQ